MTSASVGEVHTSVQWKSSLAYEQMELLNKLQSVLSMRIFSPDDIMVVVKEHTVSCPGNEPDRIDTIAITGRASPMREQLYLKIVRGIRHTMVADIGFHIRFGIGVGDVLPAVSVEPLVATPQSRSCRYWQRAMWAMRCGIIRKIADARALTQARVNSTATVRDSMLVKKHTLAAKPSMANMSDGLHQQSSLVMEPSTTTTSSGDPQLDPNVIPRRYRPISQYHAVCSSPTIELHRLCSNVPTVFVIWTSWDTASMMWLQQNIFSPDSVPAEPTSPTTPSTPFSSSPPDPWLTFVSKFVAPLPKPAPPLESASGKKKNKSSVRAALVGARTSKRAAIVLVCLDEDRQRGANAFDELRRQFRYWSSQEVAMSAIWGGEEGLRSPIAAYFDISTLPLVCCVLPPGQELSRDLSRQLSYRRIAQSKDKFHQELSYRAGFNPAGYLYHEKITNPKVDWPQVVLCEEPSRTAAPELNVAGDGDICRRSNIMQMWEDVPKEKRDDCITRIIAVQKQSEAPLVFESNVIREFPLDQGKYSHESDLVLRAVVSSSVSMVGSAFAGHIRAFGEPLEFLKSRVKNFEFCVQTLEESDPIEIRFLPVTPEQRVKGHYHCVLCSHCRKAIDTDSSCHFQCLHCHPSESTVCDACFTGGRHFRWHIAVKVRPGGLERIPVLWGRSNVTMLPTIRDSEVVESDTRTHTGVYCNICREPVVGSRWKCCMCHGYDMCAACERVWWNNVLSNSHDHRHLITHMMMFIPLAVPGDGNQLLCPRSL